MKAVAMKVFFINGEEFEQEVVIAPSKRAVTKQMEDRQVEVLKQMDITDKYSFTIADVLAGNLSDEQKQLLTYVLTEAGVEDGTDNN